MDANAPPSSGEDRSAFLVPDPVGEIAPGRRPTFSVVIATWQSAGTVGSAVRSALDQSEPPAEVVVCDDGSTDDVAGALVGFGDRVRLLTIPHSGPSIARNTAAAAVTGDFVAVLDADDTWEPRRLERLADLGAARPDLDLLTTDAWFVVDGRRSGRFYDAAGAFPVRDQLTEILRRNFFFAHVAVRRTQWQAHGGYDADIAYAEDWDFWLRLLAGGCRAGCVAEPLADYAIRPQSQSGDRAPSLLARVTVLDRALSQQSLTPEQRSVAAAARGEFLRRSRAAAAERALVEAAPDRRTACRRLLSTPGVSLTSRLHAAAAWVAPAYAGRRLRERNRSAGHTGYDRRIPASRGSQ